MRRQKVEIKKAYRKAKVKIGIYYSTTTSFQARKYYSISILLNPRYKSDNQLRVKQALIDNNLYDQQVYYQNKLKELYDRDYIYLIPGLRRLELLIRLQPRGEFSLNIVIDQLNTVIDPILLLRLERDIVLEVAREFNKQRSQSKLLIPSSLLVVTNTLQTR